jgi:hypothetical protein
MFWGITDCFVTVQTSAQNRLYWGNERTSSLNAVASVFFATNTFDLPHWTLNSCLSCFGPFLYFTNFGAKWVELVLLMHKFVQRSRVEMFRNERTRSTHWSPNLCFGAFLTISVQHKVRCKTGWTGAINTQVRGTKARQNFSQWTHLIHPISSQTHVLERFGPFCNCTNFGAKQPELVLLMHKFVQRSRVKIFSQWMNPIHPIGP